MVLCVRSSVQLANRPHGPFTNIIGHPDAKVMSEREEDGEDKSQEHEFFQQVFSIQSEINEPCRKESL